LEIVTLLIIKILIIMPTILPKIIVTKKTKTTNLIKIMTAEFKDFWSWACTV